MARARRFTAPLWEYGGKATWYFVSLPPDLADDIAEQVGDHVHGFDSVRVEVTIGSSTWQTSLFPDKGRATYVLPVKKAVREAEGLAVGTPADVRLTVLDPEVGPAGGGRTP